MKCTFDRSGRRTGMHREIKLLAIAAVSITIAGCATGPRSKAPTASAAPATAVSGVPAKTDDGSPRINVSLVKNGYRAVKNRGQVFYCRSQPVTGTRFQ